MKLFVSYARLDGAIVESLLARLRDLGHDVWSDERLVGGQDWWLAILERLRWCDVLIVARSSHYERSKVCRAELQYATELDRLVLPVRVGDSPEDTDGLGALDTIDWRALGEQRVAHLAAAMPSEADVRPLPLTLPTPPPTPLVSLHRPQEIITGETISRPDEDELLRAVRPLVDDPDASETIIELLRMFVSRPTDVTAAGLAEAEALLAEARQSGRGGRGTSSRQDLRALLGGAERGNLLPILGFGLTDGLIGSRLALARRLAKENNVARTGQLSDDLPGVAQFLAGFHGEDDMRELVLDEIRRTVGSISNPSASVKPSVSADSLFASAWGREVSQDEPYMVLANLPCPIFVNAHPSNLLTLALRAVGKLPRVEHCRWRGDVDHWPESVLQRTPAQPEYQPTVDEPLVFQVFGSFEYPETLVLSEDDFLKFLNQIGRREGATAQEAIPLCVKAAATTSRLLMLGFGLEDLDARVLMTALIEQEGGAKRRVSSLAVQVDPEGPAHSADQAREYLKRYFSDERRIHMYWGRAEAFAADLAALRGDAT
ncbi:MAG: TIR domain-containing protein [Acidimicrobiales bacterium]